MAGRSGHDLRERKIQPVPKPTAAKTVKSTTAKTVKSTTATITTNRFSSASRTSLSSTSKPSFNRLSLLSSSTSQSTIAKSPLEVKVLAFESRIAVFEASHSKLEAENIQLRELLTGLISEVRTLKEQVDQLKSAQTTIDSGISLEQQELNSNIIIRGVALSQETPESELLAVFSGLRTHLGIADIENLAPVSVKVLNPDSDKAKTTSRPLQVRLRSISAKRQFLQVRRTKTVISTADIGINQHSHHSVLITEHLTRQNQELLYQARSLRGRDGYKFVWSNNGQILVRKHQNSKVIRISDSAQVNHLRSELQLPPLNLNGRDNPTAALRAYSSDTQV